MKKKFSKILGVGLTVALLASLMLVAIPVSADPGKLKFDVIPMPKIGEVGDYVLTPEMSVGPIAVTPDGETLFAAGIGERGGVIIDRTELFKSTDDGYTWIMKDDFSAEAGADDSPIVDIAVSPDYASDDTVLVATEETIYESLNSGDDFAAVWDAPDGVITDIDVTLDEKDYVAVIVGTAEAGEVYVSCRATTGMSWQEQDIGDWDVLAVAFSPNFADDEGIVAVVTDGGMTRVRFAFGKTRDGGGWDEDIGDARVRDAWSDDFESDSACIAFAEDFDVDGATSNVCFVGIDAGEDGVPAAEGDLGGERGDVYQIMLHDAPAYSSAIDLDVRGVVTTLNPTETNITSIDVCGDTEDANILVGTNFVSRETTPYCYLVYQSTDGGESWDTSGTKSPTGGDKDSNSLFTDAATQVLMSPNFLTSGVAYASTVGEGTSAISLSEDSGESWNQISLIDYGDPDTGYTVTHPQVSAGTYNTDDTIYLVTQVGGADGALWNTTNNGDNWERIWSYANPTVTPNLERVRLTSEDTLFAFDRVNFKAWRSSDGGATFPKSVALKDESHVTQEKVYSPTTIWTGHADGSLWWTTNTGRRWTEPDDNDAKGAGGAILEIARTGDSIALGTSNGRIYISSDAGETFERVGITNPGGVAIPSFDLGYATNYLLYASSTAGGVLRTEVDVDDPGDSEWEQIDEDSPGAGGVVPVGCPVLPPGILYSADVTDGLWRSVNPSADIDGLYPPYFESVTKGLDGMTLKALQTVGLFPTTWLCTAAGGDYWEQLVSFTDTLCAGPELVLPEDKDIDAGVILSELNWQPKVTLRWTAMKKATSYQYQVATDDEFSGVVDWDNTSGQQAWVLFAPGETYYWRVRVADGTLHEPDGAPVISPWSEVWSFTTILGAGPARPLLVAPYGGLSTGGVDTQLKPAFQWTQVHGATGYKLQVSKDATFATTIIDKTTGTGTSWLCDQDLEYSATYFWRVKAVGATESPWSDVGSFTTVAPPPLPPGQILSRKA